VLVAYWNGYEVGRLRTAHHYFEGRFLFKEHFGERDKIPTEVIIEDKTAVEQMRLIQQLEEEDKQTIFKLIDKMLTNKKFKDFFAKNVATL
jgi:hypothetical protein